jgi:hypothetical protein
VRSKVIASILETCKHVNQIALLQNLHDTKMCDDLLEADLTKEPWDAQKTISSLYKGKISVHDLLLLINKML